MRLLLSLEKAMADLKQLDEISIKVDEFLLNLLQEYKLDPLAISAVVSGRVYMFNESAGTVNEFRELLEHVLEIQPSDYNYNQNMTIQ